MFWTRPVIPDYEYDRAEPAPGGAGGGAPGGDHPGLPHPAGGRQDPGRLRDLRATRCRWRASRTCSTQRRSRTSCERMREALGPGAEYSVEPKVDGLSVALEYRDGVFVRGATRGDGRVGEDVTENLAHHPLHPHDAAGEAAPAHRPGRGVYVPQRCLRSINARRELEGKPLMANPRNAAAGSLRQLDPKICARSGSWISRCSTSSWRRAETFATHAETLDYLAAQHFKVIPHKTLSGTAEIQAEIDRINEERMELPLRHRRRGRQGRPPGGPGAVWAPPPSSPSGRWPIKYPPEKKFSAVPGHRGAGGPHRRADAQGGADPGASGGHHRHQRHPPQPGLHYREGHPHRGHGAGAEGGGDHPGDFERGLRQAPGGHGALSRCRTPARCAAPQWSGTRTARPCAAPARSARPSCCGTSPTSPAGTPWTSTACGPAVMQQLIETGLISNRRRTCTACTPRTWPSWTGWGRSPRRT